MLNRLLLIVIIVPLAVILIAFAVANRGSVAFTLDPFNPGNPALTLQAPLFVMLFAALGIGLVLGGLATWLKQGYYRRQARESRKEAERLRQPAIRPPAAQPASQSTALARV